ncbi:MAG TPA: TIGR02680 family protein, partial [Solirubrobacteraceae bacterium]|nr:TIGR02680 family protein [Solirubrobacteraceae bacterium]
GRAGAALWQLVDFAEHVDEHRRAGLEAALEASGLLDAWVTPDGLLADPTLADVLLLAGPPAGGSTLMDLLVCLPDQPVATGAVERVLRQVGLGATDAHTWVDVDGRFAVGALTGRGAKQRAEHVGAAAREARRARRIAVLRAEVDELTAELALDDTALVQLDARRDALASELAALPSADAVGAAIGAVRLSLVLRENAARDQERALTEARAAAAEELGTDAARREHAVEHSLPAYQEPAALDELGEATAQVLGGVPGLRRAWERADAQVATVTTLRTRVGEAQERAAATAHATSDERAEADRLTAEHRAREAVLGHTGQQLRARHDSVAAELRTARKAARDERATAHTAAVAVARLEHDAKAKEDEAAARRRSREATAAALSALAIAGILGLVLGDATPPDAADARDWSITRALEVARALPAELLAVSSSSGALAVEVQRRIALLDRELAEADMRAYGSQTADGVLLVQVGDGTREQPLSEVLTELDSEIAERERVLTAQERRVFSDALVEEIAEHLRQRIHEVRTRVEHMNAVLRRSQTAAGKVVELDWTPAEREDDTQRAALGLLRRGMRNLGEDARDELVAFFRARVARARHEHADGAPKPLAETLGAAFDYRRWFAFGLYERSDDGRVRLTKRRHAIGSGGEQSVLIHLPLFAAAAALYGDSGAPRLIMLDEALSGIDDDTRERVLAATVAFDLDVVMTSHELWGTYRSVPQLSIYQLHRENGLFGVHALQFLWDGDVLHELEQGELLV